MFDMHYSISVTISVLISTGERATITNGEVEITDDGYPDFTSTFQSERTVVKMNSTMNQSQVTAQIN